MYLLTFSYFLDIRTFCIFLFYWSLHYLHVFIYFMNVVLYSFYLAFERTCGYLYWFFLFRFISCNSLMHLNAYKANIRPKIILQLHPIKPQPITSPIKLPNFKYVSYFTLLILFLNDLLILCSIVSFCYRSCMCRSKGLGWCAWGRERGTGFCGRRRRGGIRVGRWILWMGEGLLCLWGSSLWRRCPRFS